MKAWITAIRPKTLIASIIPVWLGSISTILNNKDHVKHLILFIFTLISCMCIQIATNLFNDAIDFMKGTDTENRLGPKRVSSAGEIDFNFVIKMSIVFCFLSVLFSIPIFYFIGSNSWVIILIGVTSISLAYFYTGGPYPLAYNGLGEIFVIIFFGIIAVLGSYFIQTGTWGNFIMFIISLQCGLYSSVLIAINNLRDELEDKANNKKTLAVIFGKKFARLEITFLCLIPKTLSLLIIFNSNINLHLIFWVLFSINIILSLFIIKKIWTQTPSKKFNTYFVLSAIQLLIFGIYTTLFFL